jgi:hypothetical protein
VEYTSGKVDVLYCCQQYDILLVTLAQTFNRKNLVTRSHFAVTDVAVTSDSDTTLDADNSSG